MTYKVIEKATGYEINANDLEIRIVNGYYRFFDKIFKDDLT